MEELRDLGKDNPFSMKDGIIFKTRSQFFWFGVGNFLTFWHYHFKTSPRKYKVHRSIHPFLFFGLSIYIPYRYQETLNTVLFTLTKSKNPYINMMVRGPAKLIIYGTSILIGQLMARWYWVFKRSKININQIQHLQKQSDNILFRSFNATRKATGNTYLKHRIYNNKERYRYAPAFQEIRPNVVS